MEHDLDPRSLTDDELLRRLSELLGRSRRVEAELVAHIAEVDARRLYAREAAPSMFAYCTGVLHLSEAEAYLRITAARASREHPMLLTMLRDGRLHLSGIARLARHLTLDNRDAILKQAEHLSRRQVEKLAAALEPRPDAPDSIRKLPPARASSLGSSSELSVSGRAEGPPGGPGPEDTRSTEDLGLDGGPEGRGLDTGGDPKAGPSELCLDRVDGTTCDNPADRAESPGHALGPSGVTRHTAPVAARARVEPLAPARYRVQFTASAELHDKLKRLQALMRPSVPDGDLATIIEAAVTEKLARLETRRFGAAKAPRKSLAGTPTVPPTRHIPAAVRRAVHERDGGRGTYTDAQGRRCNARERLEFHHHDRPFGRGGDHSPGNVRLMCKAHNLLLAEGDYGREKMDRYRRTATGVSEPPAIYAIGRMSVHAGTATGAWMRRRGGSGRFLVPVVPPSGCRCVTRAGSPQPIDARRQ